MLNFVCVAQTKDVADVLQELQLCAELGYALCLGSMAGSCGKARKQNSP